MQIPFNKPYLTGKEAHYIYQAVYNGHISGNGTYTKLCQRFFEERWGFKKTLLTTSCTDALEMCALLLDIQPGDEVIVPSYTFVSTALAFVRQGANIIFADSREDHPGIDEDKIEKLITPKTKAIVVVHYAGVACDMDKVMAIANKYDVKVVEDAAQAIDSYFIGRLKAGGRRQEAGGSRQSLVGNQQSAAIYQESSNQNPATSNRQPESRRPLGSIGHLGTFSFHETKNIQCGEGGLLAINDEQYIERAEMMWEKGTNRAEFFRGEVNKYGWKEIGSSFLPSDMIAAFLYAQLENLDNIQNRRKEIWNWYNEHVNDLWGKEFTFKKPVLPGYATNNAHMYYLVFKEAEERTRFIQMMKEKDIHPVFHYLSLHKSPYYQDRYKGGELPNSDRYEQCLVRLPLWYELNLKNFM